MNRYETQNSFLILFIKESSNHQATETIGFFPKSFSKLMQLQMIYMNASTETATVVMQNTIPKTKPYFADISMGMPQPIK